jgi:hypothetical protein
MVGAAAHGLVGVDAELQRSALAAQERTIENDTIRVRATERGSDCQAPDSREQI